MADAFGLCVGVVRKVFCQVSFVDRVSATGAGWEAAVVDRPVGDEARWC
jgi:hypothetical protein